MKTLNTIIFASLTALVLSNNVNAEETIFNSNDLQSALSNSIEFAINDINKPNVTNIVKQQLAAMNMEHNVQPFLALTKIEENKKSAAKLVSE